MTNPNHKSVKMLERLCRIAIGVALLTAFGAPAGAASSPPAAPQRVYPLAFQGASDQDEIADLSLVPVDALMSANDVMHSRPFVLPFNSPERFDFTPDELAPWSSEAARIELASFLGLRGIDATEIQTALDRYDNPEVIQIVPSPSARAALLMLSEWNPYEAVIESILEGKNHTNKPFASVNFGFINVDGAVATLQMDDSTGQERLIINERYQGEPPQQLIPVIVHESLHGGFSNSFEEETIANVLDSIAYAEVVLVDPDVTPGGTELGAFNNLQLYALLNSTGRRGAGNVGVSTSPAGDVYVGPGLGDFDADSIRSAVGLDPYYGELPRGGSISGPTAEALIGRFSESELLERPLHYTEAAITVIDHGVGEVITPRRALALAVALGLNITIGVNEVDAAALSTDGLELTSRPFIPVDTGPFDLGEMHRQFKPYSDSQARAALHSVQAGFDVPEWKIKESVRWFDRTDAVALIPEPSLRAAVLLLSGVQPWSSLVSSIIDGQNSTGKPVHVEFQDFPNTAPALWDSTGWEGGPVIWINSMLKGERPEILASAVVEGELLEGIGPSSNQAILAAVLSTAVAAQLALRDPSLLESKTFGTISRNRDLLALLNSVTWSEASTPNADSIGFLMAAGQSADILPGLFADSTSFANYVLSSSRDAIASEGLEPALPPGLLDVLRLGGVSLAAGQKLDQALLQFVDQQLDHFLAPDDALQLARIMNLHRIASSQ